ncbi:MAG: hypothetical protein NTV32_07330 [Gammaproteobacteria bacterium]|nr:hypothetical protein [Gammaproteobacteria bacterium]
MFLTRLDDTERLLTINLIVNKLKEIVSEEVLRDTDESVKLLRTFEGEKRVRGTISSTIENTRLDQIKNLSKELETVIEKLSSSFDSYPMIESSLVYLINFSNKFDKPALNRALEKNVALGTPASTDVSESSTASGGSGAGTFTGSYTSSSYVAPTSAPTPFSGCAGTGTGSFTTPDPTTPFLVMPQLRSLEIDASKQTAKPCLQPSLF